MLIAIFLFAFSGASSIAAQAQHCGEKAAPDVALPTLFLIGDSTVNNSTSGLLGWGNTLAEYFDQTQINIDNRARGGRSSRTYYTEGLWNAVLNALKPGDFLLIQFGHNDGGSLTQGRARASLRGIGDEIQEAVIESTGQQEVVHTYGWYIRKYIREAKAKGATPIVLSPVPRNIWKDARVMRASDDYGKWAGEAAKMESAFFIDLNEIVARHYEDAGPEKVAAVFFAEDHTHTTKAGAQLNARSVVEGLRTLKSCPLNGYLSTNPQAP
jgi:lysophospholipase L1-like esterase